MALLFDSLPYMLLFPAVWLLYQFIPDNRRWLVLLLASVSFYAALKAPLLVVAWALVVVVSYYCGLAIARQGDEPRKRRILWGGIAANFGVLCSIKYLRVIVEMWTPAPVAEARWSDLFVTLGVSYYTLQAVSYLADIYLETLEPERHFGRFALYLGFFPKMLQGPIERGGDLLPQLKSPYRCNYDNVRSGMLLFAWGLFKKVAVANRLAIYVTAVYRDVHGYGGITLMLATYLYAIQILADFSGYTDMALGVARMFNIRLTQNFNAPYLATSIADFWRRWHISFSRWILDYIFKPLQMEWRNWKNVGVAGALLVTFLFSGLWHGVSWNFVVWGLLHGLFLSASVFWKPWQTRMWEKIGLHNHPLRRLVQVLVTFNLVSFAWIFFRAGSLNDGFYVATHLFSGVGSYLVAVASHLGHLTQLKYLWDPILMEKGLRSFVLLTVSVMIMVLGNVLKKRIRIDHQPAWIRWPLYCTFLVALCYLSIYDDVGFVYFQF